MQSKMLYVWFFLVCGMSAKCDVATNKTDFHDIMVNNCKSHDIDFCRTDLKWCLAEELYRKYYLEYPVSTDNPRIPYIIHHIWLGSSLPDYVRGFRQTWIDRHPDWTFILWTDYPEEAHGRVVLTSFEELAAYLKKADCERFIIMDMRCLRLYNQLAFETRAKNYGEMSDILRYEVLHNIGGLYVDTDFECLRSCKEFHHCCEFYTGVAHTREFILYNGLIGAAPGMGILEEVILSLRDRPIMEDSLSYSGPYFFTDCFAKTVSTFKGRAIAFPVTYFYAWPPYERFIPVEDARRYIVDESYALHHWKVSWLANRSVENKEDVSGKEE